MDHFYRWALGPRPLYCCQACKQRAYRRRKKAARG